MTDRANRADDHAHPTAAPPPIRTNQPGQGGLVGAGAESSSILDGLALDPGGSPARKSRVTIRMRAAQIEARVWRGAVGLWRSPRSRAVTLGLAGLALAGGGLWAWRASRIQPPPDYKTASLDVLFDYTLFTDDFNRLPVQRRLELIRELTSRVQGMGSGDSVMMAMIASLIVGDVREQLEKNVSRLFVDLLDNYAGDYDPTAPIEDRRSFMEAKYLELTSTLASLGGQTPDGTEAERLESGRERAKRRAERGREGADPDQLARTIDVMNGVIGAQADGHQKVRIATFMRDMGRMLRAE